MPEYPIQELVADIARSMAPVEFDRAAQSALLYFDEITENAAAKLACHAGCSLCCSLRVDVFAHEVFLLANHIRQRFTADEMTDLLERLARHAATVIPLTPFEHATTNIQC